MTNKEQNNHVDSMDDKEAKQDHSEGTYYLSKIEYALLGLLQDLGVKALDYPGLNALKTEVTSNLISQKALRSRKSWSTQQ